MAELSERLAALTPQQRRLLEQMRQQKAAARERAAPAAAALASAPFCLVAPADRERLPEDVEDAYPLTRMQAGMLYHMELAPDYLVYQNVDSRVLHLAFRPELLERAVAKVVARHPILRTAFDLTSYHEPLQLVKREAHLPLAIEDLRDLVPAEQERIVQAYVAGEKRRRFDLSRPPLLRVQLHRRGEHAVQVTLTDFHPIIDGWSLNAVWQEIQRHYVALLAGRELPDEPPPAVPYREFVWLERQAVDSAEHRRFWQGQLAGCSVLELPRWPEAQRRGAAAAPRPVIKDVITVRDEVFAGLKELARSAGVPLKSVLLAAHVKVMSLIGGRRDVLTGLTTHGRPELPGGDEVLGLFFNTVPLRQRLTPGASWRAVVRRSFELERELLPFRRFPLADLQQSWGQQALLETTFNVTQFHLAKGADQPAPPGGEDAAGPGTALEENHFPLFAGFNVTPGAERLEVRIACHVAHLTPEQIAETTGCYLRVLAAMARDPDAPHDARAFHSAPAHHRLAVEWNDTAAPIAELCVHQLVAAQAERSPEAVAALFAGEALSYAALAARAARIARSLKRRGVGPEVRVGICMERSLELLSAVLGVLAAGGAYLPLDPAYPAERLAYVRDDSGVGVVVTAELLRELAAETAVDAGGDGADLPRPRPENAAYVIYTSGSTGRPKGVVVPHRGVVSFLASMARRPGLGRDDLLLAVTTLSFDIAGLELFLPLMVGGRVELASRELAADGPRLVAHLGRGFTALQATPATWRMLVDCGWRGPGLKVLCGGQALPRPLAAALAERGAAVWNLYGPTETTIWSAIARVDRAATTEGDGPVALGAPIANTHIYIVNPFGHPTPLGTPGELAIGGAGVTRGYLGRPALTAERFVPAPLGGRPGERLYRTGDLGRWRPPGALEFLGRLDHQVKVRGFRIELGEIEAVLETHPALADCAVGVQQGGAGDGRLVAWIVPRPGAAAPVEELRRHLLARLPDYMVPSLFVALERLPLTPNGKVDRRALPDPEPGRPALGTAYTAPRTPLEERVAAVWARVLGLERVGVDDRFFELGGHSLNAMQLIVKLRQELGVDLPLPTLFAHPTVAALCAALAPGGGEGSAAAAPALPQLVPDPARRHAPFPLTDLQQGYWMGGTGAFELGNVSAHTYQEIDVDGLDPARLERAWERLVERHDALRLRILDDGRQQVLERAPPYPIAVLDLRAAAPADAAAELAAVRRRMSDHGPRLDGGPLFELRSTLLPGGVVRLHLSLSLLISDARSFYLFTRELGRLYVAPDVPLPPLTLSLRDYVVAVRRLEEGEAFARALAYWRERLPRLPAAPELPLVAAPAEVVAAQMQRRAGVLEQGAWQRLKARAGELGVTATVLLATAASEVLAAWSRRRRFLLNLLYFNRLPLHPQVHELAANLSSTLLLEVDAGVNEGFGARVRRVQAQLWRDMDHALVSGVRVQRELARLRGSMAGTIAPVAFASTLNVNPAVAEPAPAAADRAAPPTAPARERQVYNHLQTPQVWLDIQVHEGEGALRYSWYAVEALFPPGLVDDMFAAFADLLARLADGDSAWQASRPVPPPAAQLAVRRQVNATAVPLPPGLLHDGFLERAAAAPESVAVLAADRSLTYGELRGLAAAYARELRRRGARPGELVAVVMEKGWEQLAAVLAVLEAGAAYLPIDPALPAERIAWLLASGRVRTALTQPRQQRELAWPEAVSTLAVEPRDGDLDLAVRAAAGAVAAAPDDLAYVIFTSGSTGLPKGVMIEHRSSLNTVADVNRRFAVGARDRVLALSSLSFDLSVYDVFGLLAAGGAVVLPDGASAREPARWAALMAASEVTVWNSVPALCEMLVDHLEGHGERLPPSLRLVMLSGDWVPVSLPDRIRALGDGVEVVALGGATEASIWSILYPVGAVDPRWPSVPYGRPMANQTFHVLDDALAPRPVWAAGDLYVGGVGLARGYWSDEARTAAAFVVAPGAGRGERLYRTGDLGRYLPSGDVEFLGREDQQVKVQGYRIELGEIESALLRHPGVRAAVAAALGPRRGSKRLTAYVVAAGDAGVDVDELRAFLAGKLPPYMVPASFVGLDELPLTANGKVDRSALPDPEALRQGAAAAFVPPRDELELALVRLWEEVLEHPGVGVRDNFFELGGHSLLAVRLMSRIARELGRELPLATLFTGSTVEGLAQLLRQQGGVEAGRDALVPIRPAGEKAPFFCVHPVGGDVLCYVELARRLDPERPFYALQTPHTPEGGTAAVTLEEMAARYVAAVRTVAPHGPYFLGGWSMGGVLAFEMARQLRSAGEEVARLVLIDAYPPAGSAAGVDDAVLASWFVRDLAQILGVRAEVPPSAFHGLEPLAQAERLLAEPALARALPPGMAAADLSRHLEVFKGNYRALLAYQARPYPGDLALFLAAERDAAAPADPAAAWSALAAGVAAHVVPGDHYTLLRPPLLETLVAHLAAYLA